MLAPVSALAIAVLAASCRAAPAPPPRPLVLVTAGSVRADAVAQGGGEPLLTPRLNRIEALWRGSAVAASSEPAVSFASLLTGVSPWQHQVLVRGDRRRVPSLPEVLARAGYRCRLYLPETLRGLAGEGCDRIDDPFSEPADAPAVSDGEFLWFHFVDAEFLRRPARGGRRRSHLEPAELLAWADPSRALPPAERQALWRAYGDRVRRLDTKIGRLVDRLRASPAWPRATLVITGTYGLELGEHGQILSGENLGRETIEVPLFVRLGKELAPLAEPPGARVAQTRIWTTLVEIAGLEASPVHPPSLFRAADPVMLSELYARNGVNRFSLLSADLQLHWTTRFAPSEARYFEARRVEAGARPGLAGESYRRVFHRLDHEFLRTPPLSGHPGSEPELALERWTADGVEPVDDPAEARRLGALLRRKWDRFVDWERTPDEERRVDSAGGSK